MERIGEPWLPGRPYRDRPGAYAIIRGEGGHLLCVEQDGELQLPGGGIDPGESPVAALHREVREETGWTIGGWPGPTLRRFGGFQRFVWMPEYQMWARKVQSIYLARAIRALGPPLEAGHIPLWLAPEVAERHLDVEGDRVMVARARRRGLI